MNILYDPLAANNSGKENAEKLKALYTDDTLSYYDITEISDIYSHLNNLPDDDTVIIAGGVNHIRRRFCNNYRFGNSFISCRILLSSITVLYKFILARDIRRVSGGCLVL